MAILGLLPRSRLAVAQAHIFTLIARKSHFAVISERLCQSDLWLCHTESMEAGATGSYGVRRILAKVSCHATSLTLLRNKNNGVIRSV